MITKLIFIVLAFFPFFTASCSHCTEREEKKELTEEFWNLEGSIGPDCSEIKKVRVTTFTYTIKEYIFEEEEEFCPGI